VAGLHLFRDQFNDPYVDCTSWVQGY